MMNGESLPLPDRWTDYLRWRISQRERPLPRSHGLYCKNCGYSHPYNGDKQLDIKYEKRSGGWYLMWLCPRTGTVLGELGGAT
jgi:hypothetical protein